MLPKFPGLDKTDLKILQALEQDSRQPNKAIARRAGVSEHVVAYRLQRLLDEGILSKIYCVIKRGALFPVGYRVFLRFQNLSEEKERQLVEKAVGCKYSNWVALCRGHWDMAISLFVKDPKHFTQLFSEIISGFEDFVQEKEILAFLEMTDFTRAYLYGGEPREMLEYDGSFKTESLDALDIKILEQLSTNSRMPSIEMAKEFGVSPDTIRNRITKLQQDGIILGHSIWLNHKKIGIDYYAILLNLKNLSRQREKALRDFAAQHPNVIFWVRTIGAYDLNLEIEIKDSELDTFLADLRNKFGDVIKNIEVLTIKKEMKYTHLTQK